MEEPREMEEKVNHIEALLEQAEEYGKTGLELLKLKALQKLSEGVSSLVAIIIVMIISLIFIVLLNIGIALWLGELLGKSYYGFFVVAGFYAFAGIILYSFRNNWIKGPVSDAIIEKAYNAE